MGLSQERLARLTSDLPWPLSRSAISAIERGRYLPGIEALLAYSKVLHLDPEEVLERARLALPARRPELSGHSFEELESRAEELGRSGDHYGALVVWDILRDRLAQEPSAGKAQHARSLATAELGRANSLVREGAPLAARSAAERALTTSVGFPTIQVEACLCLVELHLLSGNPLLAEDAAQRAATLAVECETAVQGRVAMATGSVHFQAGRLEDALRVWLAGREAVRRSSDGSLLTQIAGDIARCHRALGRLGAARAGFFRAIELSRRHQLSVLEGHWLIELGWLALESGDPAEARRCAAAALRIARPREHVINVFRAEWLEQAIAQREDPEAFDPARFRRLKKLLPQLGEHASCTEVAEFKKRLNGPMEGTPARRPAPRRA